MSQQIKIKRGYDIKLKGKAIENLQNISLDKYAVKPTDFHGIFPKLFVRVGDKVKRGTPIFFDKNNEYIKIPSPVSGTVTEVLRGAKRKMLEIRIESDATDEFVDYGKQEISSLTSEKVTEKLVESGLWSFIRQRPYTVVANPSDKPKAIFISGFDSAPLAANTDFILNGKEKSFQAGLDALSKLASKVYLGISPKTTSAALKNAKGVEVNTFDGPHPAGNVGIQIHHISPINKGEVVWTVQPQDVVAIGDLFLTGQYISDINIALVGSEVEAPQYYSVKRGASIGAIVNGKVKTECDLRYISGNVLTGTKVEPNGYLSFYHNSISVIPEGNKFEFFGWLVPSPKKHSFYRTALSWLTPNKEYRLNTNLNGGERAFVVTGALEKVLPMDILPIPLIKSIMINDIDQMEQLGIYEVDEEDFALCEYISTSKIEMQDILRNGLNMMRKEMS
jgi:Na+-transporting NADH:ubiquinone oxidoreductase subunit A